MGKSTHFIGQPMYGQLIDLLDKRKVLEFGKNTVQKDVMYINNDGQMAYSVQNVTFTKEVSKEKTIVHHARIVTYVDIKKTGVKLVSLLTNDTEMEAKNIVDIYRGLL